MPEIIIIDTRKPQETKSILIAPQKQPNQECFLGREDICCIALDDSLASRIHGKIAYRDGKYYYTDLGSKNGSKVNNINAQPDREYLLKPSDTIALGNHLLWVKAIAKMEVAAPPQPMTPRQYMPLATVDVTTLETWTKGTKQVKCVQIIDETADVKTFSFVSEPPVKFNYQPGQFITLNLDINGKRVKHPCSISSTPSRPHSIEVTVKRIPKPVDRPSSPPEFVSNWLHDNLKVGSEIEINAPMGKFTNFANPSNKLLLISAGIGISPMMSMSRWICDTISNVDVVFLHSAGSPEDIIFRQELEMMAARYPKFKLAITVTDPAPGQPWYGYTGRIDETILPAIASDYKDRTVYVCGSNSFTEATKKLLEKIDFPMGNYYEESFSGAKKKKPATPTVPSGDRTSVFQPPSTPTPKSASKPPSAETPVVSPTSIFSPESTPKPPSAGMPVVSPTSIFSPEPAPPPTVIPTVAPTSLFPSDPIPEAAPESLPPVSPTPSFNSVIVLSKSGQEIACDGKEPILSVAEAEGADLPFGCRVGACEACKVKKIEGEVIYDNDISCEDGFIYTCVARPVGKVVIEA